MLQHIKLELPFQLLKLGLFVLVTLLTLIIWGSVTEALGQRSRRVAAKREQPVAQVVEQPFIRDYRGVQIGMTADAARQKLGAPTNMGDTQDVYVFSEKETAQVFYDGAKTVTAISVDYVGEVSGAPDCKAVLGTQLEHKADGSVYKMIRYPKHGYWVSYNRTAGEAPIVTVTIQKSAY